MIRRSRRGQNKPPEVVPPKDDGNDAASTDDDGGSENDSVSKSIQRETKQRRTTRGQQQQKTARSTASSPQASAVAPAATATRRSRRGQKTASRSSSPLSTKKQSVAAEAGTRRSRRGQASSSVATQESSDDKEEEGKETGEGDGGITSDDAGTQQKDDLDQHDETSHDETEGHDDEVGNEKRRATRKRSATRGDTSKTTSTGRKRGSKRATPQSIASSFTTSDVENDGDAEEQGDNEGKEEVPKEVVTKNAQADNGPGMKRKRGAAAAPDESLDDITENDEAMKDDQSGDDDENDDASATKNSDRHRQSKRAEARFDGKHGESVEAFPVLSSKRPKMRKSEISGEESPNVDKVEKGSTEDLSERAVEGSPTNSKDPAGYHKEETLEPDTESTSKNPVNEMGIAADPSGGQYKDSSEASEEMAGLAQQKSDMAPGTGDQEKDGQVPKQLKLPEDRDQVGTADAGHDQIIAEQEEESNDVVSTNEAERKGINDGTTNNPLDTKNHVRLGLHEIPEAKTPQRTVENVIQSTTNHGTKNSSTDSSSGEDTHPKQQVKLEEKRHGEAAGVGKASDDTHEELPKTEDATFGEIRGAEPNEDSDIDRKESIKSVKADVTTDKRPDDEVAIEEETVAMTVDERVRQDSTVIENDESGNCQSSSQEAPRIDSNTSDTLRSEKTTVKQDLQSQTRGTNAGNDIVNESINLSPNNQGQAAQVQNSSGDANPSMDLDIDKELSISETDRKDEEANTGEEAEAETYLSKFDAAATAAETRTASDKNVVTEDRNQEESNHHHEQIKPTSMSVSTESTKELTEKTGDSVMGTHNDAHDIEKTTQETNSSETILDSDKSALEDKAPIANQESKELEAENGTLDDEVCAMVSNEQPVFDDEISVVERKFDWREWDELENSDSEVLFSPERRPETIETTRWSTLSHAMSSHIGSNDPWTFPSLEDVKISRAKSILFAVGSQAHKGKGFERLFAEYWDALCLRLTGRLSDYVSHRCELAISAFLTSTKLRRLHNRFIIAIMKRASRTIVPAEQVGHVPVEWRDRIVIKTTEQVTKNEVESREQGRMLEMDFRVMAQEPFVSEENPYKESWTLLDIVTKDQGVQKDIEVTADSYLSPRIPGALAIQPQLADILGQLGMQASESAMWLLVIAMNEHAKKILRDSIALKLANEAGRVGVPTLRYPKILSAPAPSRKRKGDLSKARAVIHSQQEKKGQQQKRIVTPLDIFAAAQRYPSGQIGSLGGSFSRFSVEHTFHAAFNSLPAVEIGHDFKQVQAFISSQVSDRATKLELESHAAKSSSGNQETTPIASSETHHTKTHPDSIAEHTATAASSLDGPDNVAKDNNNNTSTQNTSVMQASSGPRADAAVIRPGSVRGGMGRGAKNLAAMMKRSIAAQPSGDQLAGNNTGNDKAGQPHAPVVEVNYTASTGNASNTLLTSAGEEKNSPTTVTSQTAVEGQASATVAQSSDGGKQSTIIPPRRGKGVGAKNLAALLARSKSSGSSTVGVVGEQSTSAPVNTEPSISSSEVQPEGPTHGDETSIPASGEMFASTYEVPKDQASTLEMETSFPVSDEPSTSTSEVPKVQAGETHGVETLIPASSEPPMSTSEAPKDQETAPAGGTSSSSFDPVNDGPLMTTSEVSKEQPGAPEGGTTSSSTKPPNNEHSMSTIEAGTKDRTNPLEGETSSPDPARGLLSTLDTVEVTKTERNNANIEPSNDGEAKEKDETGNGDQSGEESTGKPLLEKSQLTDQSSPKDEDGLVDHTPKSTGDNQPVNDPVGTDMSTRERESTSVPVEANNSGTVSPSSAPASADVPPNEIAAALIATGVGSSSREVTDRTTAAATDDNSNKLVETETVIVGEKNGNDEDDNSNNKDNETGKSTNDDVTANAS